MIAKIHSFNYEAGEYTKTQGHKGYERTHYRNGKHINPTGFGWASEYRPSRITIGICVDGAYAEVWIDRFFKDSWGRLTEKRLTAIRETMPEEVNVVKNEGVSGKVYYTVTEESLESWLDAAKNHCR